MGNSPYDFIMNKVWEQYKENTNTFYRMFTYHDFFCICQRLYNIYQEWDDLEVFYEGYNNVIREIQTDFGGVKVFQNWSVILHASVFVCFYGG